MAIDQLRELSGIGRKLVEGQDRTMDEHADKAEHLLTLAVVIISAATELSYNLVPPDAGLIALPFAVAIAGELALAGIGFWLVGVAYLGSRRRPLVLKIGWDLAEVERVAKDGRYSMADILLADIEANRQNFERNSETLNNGQQLKQTSMLFFFGPGVLLVVAYLYGLVAFRVL